MELIGVLLWVLVAAPDTDAIANARRAVYERGGYQSTIPGERTEPTRASRDRRTTDRTRRRDATPRREPVEAGEIGESVLWVFAGVLGILALLWLATYRRERRRIAEAVHSNPATVAPIDAPAAPASDAEKLARAGDYAGAIHATLLQVLADFADRLKPAWTSREVARTIRREEFAQLVGMVERTLFGGRAATPDDYEQARTWGVACRAGDAE